METEMKVNLLGPRVGSVSISRRSRDSFKDRMMKAVIVIRFAFLLSHHQHGSQEDNDNDDNTNGVIPEEKFFSATTSFDNQMQLDDDSSVTSSISFAIPGQSSISIGEQNSRSINISSGEGTTDNQMQLLDDFLVSSLMANPGPISPNNGLDSGNRISYRRIKKGFIMLIVTGNLSAEVVAISIQQLGGQNNFHALLISGVMVLISLILCLMEICIQDEEVRFYPDILGLLFAVGQLAIIVIAGILLKTKHKNPIQISVSCLIFAVSQFVLKIVVCNKDNISPQNDGRV